MIKIPAVSAFRTGRYRSPPGNPQVKTLDAYVNGGPVQRPTTRRASPGPDPAAPAGGPAQPGDA
jgi:hypothetical protein